MLRLEAVVKSNIFHKRQRRAKYVSLSFPILLNIFGSRRAADDVASQLSQVSAYLQHPQSPLEPGVVYHNPQFLSLPGENWDMGELIGTGNIPNLAHEEKISEVVGRILESLTQTNTAEDEKLELKLNVGLASKLKLHQENGLRFILQREEEAFGKRISSWLSKAVNLQSEVPLPLSFGGLIADVMGLGKTLTMLAAILQSMPIAENFSNFYEMSGNDRLQQIRTKATLVVVSSIQVLDSWVSEIQAHFYPEALSWIRFHGQGRPREPDAMRSVSIVLTTYATLVADANGCRTLYQLEWYRVVLDEAHWIRNSGSKQFKAAASLDCSRRWCLTGTPIQNKLDDLVSLAQFLRLPPLSTKPDFQKHVLGPLSQGGPNFAKPLQGYLESYCLRRSEKCLTLLPTLQEEVKIQFSSEERAIYNRILADTKKQIDSLISKRDSRSCSKLFSAMLKMRMRCNFGTFISYTVGVSSLGQLHSEDGCERCSLKDEDTFMLLGNYSFCPDCRRPLYQSSPLPESFENYESDSNDNGLNARGVDDRDITAVSPRTPQPGFSTKLSTVAQNVARAGPTSKHIIFSSWTSTLDLLSRLLNQLGIPSCRVEGRTSYSERSKNLGTFKDDPQVPVLLMSIGTGAVGLNLTVANNVHLVEPQWNPAIEEQAVARALRMGQTRQVTIFRYVVQDTVEQNIINLQKRKTRLAKFTFDTERRGAQAEFTMD
ncbi:SNF2 family N-terminal domain-containing protein [Xylaria bambusicola]|uniref:SNF2 family N-terminal domain-containing protein n=1 Tax=Xylaria bambusicola TaxID=326684 RepID=UPI0020075D1D|nr:SNF2 family N-terminal domain-containing protein [Xylaria bambusicola]KAI0516716.1 SNF2 family N-terminal domain-containing protein [Xylaria bambusicola]